MNTQAAPSVMQLVLVAVSIGFWRSLGPAKPLTSWIRARCGSHLRFPKGA